LVSMCLRPFESATDAGSVPARRRRSFIAGTISFLPDHGASVATRQRRWQVDFRMRACLR
jgi:hypothetical protein